MSDSEPLRMRLTADERRSLLRAPPVLYHYCSSASLISILQSRRFWAGDARQMNDAQELVYARKVAARVAARLIADDGYGYGEAGEALLQSLASESYNYWEWDRYFIVCFSEHSDQLSQWRAYADDGLGYAIGIRSSAHFSAGGPRPVVLERVIYDPTEQDALVESIIGAAVGEADHRGTDNFLSGLWEILAIIKNPAFSEEKEWRLIVQDWRGDGSGPPFRFVPSRFGVAAKVELACVPSADIAGSKSWTSGDLASAINLPLVHLVFGPRVAAESAAFRLVEQCDHWARHETLRDALAAESGVHISASAASYR